MWGNLHAAVEESLPPTGFPTSSTKIINQRQTTPPSDTFLNPNAHHTAAKMTQFLAGFKQNDLQNCAIREILAKFYRIAPQNCAELVPKLLLRIPLYVDFSILIPLCSMMMSIHCFIGIFVGPLITNCIKYQANQK